MANRRSMTVFSRRRLLVPVLFLATALLGFVPVAEAYTDWPAAPGIGALPIGKQARRSGGQRMARVAATVGMARMAAAKAASASALRADMPLGDGDALLTGPDGRVRVELTGGDFLHVGGDTLLRLEQTARGPMVRVWQGRLAAYGLPVWQGGKKTLHLETPRGQVAMRVAKVGLEVTAGGGVTVQVFDNLARWQPENNAPVDLGAGEEVGGGWGSGVSRLEKGAEAAFTALVSPEVPLVKEALTAFTENKYGQAATLFGQVQQSFPYNGLTAYHLGLIHLKRNNLSAAIKQWERYERIDPKGAKEKDIQKSLTLMISKRMKQEVKSALANEKQLSSAPPEPNSIAVVPYENKGDKAYAVLAKGITAMIVTDLAKVPGIKVLERAKIQKLVDEIKLSQSGLVAEETSVRTGRILKAEKMVLGNYTITKPEGTP